VCVRLNGPPSVASWGEWKGNEMFIVFYDDDNGLCCPYTFDDSCEGAIHAGNGDVALFSTRAKARTAIRISTANARLMKAQGKPENSDFTEFLKHVKIRRCTQV